MKICLGKAGVFIDGEAEEVDVDDGIDGVDDIEY